jgi:hypothetical protein
MPSAPDACPGMVPGQGNFGAAGSVVRERTGAVRRARARALAADQSATMPAERVTLP